MDFCRRVPLDMTCSMSSAQGADVHKAGIHILACTAHGAHGRQEMSCLSQLLCPSVWHGLWPLHVIVIRWHPVAPGGRRRLALPWQCFSVVLSIHLCRRRNCMEQSVARAVDT